MAACTFAVATPDTGVTANTSGAFTPALNDLLVVGVAVSDSVDTGSNSQLTSSIAGFTFSFVTSRVAGAVNTLYIYASDFFVGSASSQTVTWTHASDQGTGSVITVYRVSGMYRTGNAAVRQTASDNAGSGATPGADFAVAALTGNPTISFFQNATNPAGVTAPVGWTENASADVGYNTPATGASSAFRDSGFTGQTIDWGSSASAWAVINVELNTLRKGGFSLSGMGR